ncbi:MAG: hypothetical protein ABIL45_09740 [candidate division WOR-3 bacterium]
MKDTHYALSLIWFSSLLYFAYQDKNYLKSNLNLLAFIISLSLVMLFRYNGIPVVIIAGILMIFLFREHLKRVLIILISVLVIFLVSNVFYYNILNVKKTAVGYQKELFVLTEYVKSNYTFKENERKIIEELISYDYIKKYYTCRTNVWFAWYNVNFDWDKFYNYREEIRKIFINAILNNPKPFIKHLICSSAYLWLPLDLRFIPYSNNFLISEIPFFKLKEINILPQIRNIIIDITNWLSESLIKNNMNLMEKVKYTLIKPFFLLFRIAIYNYILLFVFILVPKLRILILPTILNVLILIISTPDSDFRYVFSSYLMCIMIYPAMLSIRNKA